MHYIHSVASYERVMASRGERVSAVIEGRDLRDVLRVVEDLISRLDNLTNAEEEYTFTPLPCWKTLNKLWFYRIVSLMNRLWEEFSSRNFFVIQIAILY